jgi:DNA-binding transcriptional ArsR family regulator
LTSEIERIWKLLGHPLRRELWRRALTSRRALSPKDLSVELNEPLGNVSYHMGRLAEGGAISLVRRDPIRGAYKNFYEATDRFDRQRVLALIGEAVGEDEPQDGDISTDSRSDR